MEKGNGLNILIPVAGGMRMGLKKGSEAKLLPG